MIIPSNRNDLSRDEQNQIFGGGMMKKFLHQQFDSPYFLDEQSRFKKPGYAVEEKIQRDNLSEANKYKLEKRRIEQLERNMLWQPKGEKEPRVRSSNTYESGIPVDPISQQVKHSNDGQQFRQQISSHQVRDLTRLQNLQNKQQPFNILTVKGVYRNMVEVPENQQQAYSDRWGQNQQQFKPAKPMLFY